MDKIGQIKSLIKRECKKSTSVPSWFFDSHLLGVEYFALEFLHQLPEANKEVVMLAVWLHDLQEIKNIEGGHAEMGAVEAGKILKKYDYSGEIMRAVQGVILSHECDSCLNPETLEQKILSSANAMSHYINDFYLATAIEAQKDLEEFKKWALEEIENNYSQKIFFDFAREMIKDRHDLIKKFLTMN